MLKYLHIYFMLCILHKPLRGSSEKHHSLPDSHLALILQVCLHTSPYVQSMLFTKQPEDRNATWATASEKTRAAGISKVCTVPQGSRRQLITIETSHSLSHISHLLITSKQPPGIKVASVLSVLFYSLRQVTPSSHSSVKKAPTEFKGIKGNLKQEAMSWFH